jgi:hypothetical protein
MHEMSAIYHSTNWTGENAIAPFMPSPVHRPSDTLSSDVNESDQNAISICNEHVRRLAGCKL